LPPDRVRSHPDASRTPQLRTLSLHDALPISSHRGCQPNLNARIRLTPEPSPPLAAAEDIVEHRGERTFVVQETTDIAFLSEVAEDRKSTRLNSSHVKISYAVFCLTKKICAIA